MERHLGLAILLGSLLPPFLLGALFSGMIKGLPIDRSMTMHAGFFDIVNLYTIVGGLAFVALVYLHGLMFIRLKTDGEIRERAGKAAMKMYMAAGAVVVLFAILTAVFTDAFVKRGAILIPVYAVAIVLYLGLYPLLRNKKEGLSFAVTGLILILVTVSFFVALFPNVLISSMGAANNLTLYKASSSPYSLKVMTIVACTMVPVVLAYTIWSYYVFRKRVTPHELHY